MFIDASALSAILLDEADARLLQARFVAARTRRIISPLAIFETVLAITHKLHLTFAAAEGEVMGFAAEIAIIPITPEIGRLAIDARARYGKGTGHPAKLNTGDCFAYACAKAHGVPLLYKGDDFVHTDLA